MSPTARRFYDLFAEYGGLLDETRYDAWLALFAVECRYNVVSRENHDRDLPAALIFCDSRAMLEDRIMALREANKYNIHTDRHLIGLPRLIPGDSEGLAVEARSPSIRPTRKARPGCSPPASIAIGWNRMGAV